jgi:hypothetical protein
VGMLVTSFKNSKLKFEVINMSTSLNRAQLENQKEQEKLPGNVRPTSHNRRYAVPLIAPPKSRAGFPETGAGLRIPYLLCEIGLCKYISAFPALFFSSQGGQKKGILRLSEHRTCERT